MPVNAKVASAYVDLVARTAQFEKALDDAKGAAQRFSREAAAEMHEARGSIALLGEEVGVHLPRHLQAFVAKLPGVSEAMSAAFNAVAVLALVHIVVEAGEKLEAFVKKNEEAAKKNAEAWQAVNRPLLEANDSLRVTNDRLADSIAKMEGRPQNGIKLAIDEAIESADKLSAKLDETLKKIGLQLKANAPLMFGGQLFAGQAPIDDIQKIWEGLEPRIRHADEEGNAGLRGARASGDAGAVKRAQDDMDRALAAIYNEGIAKLQPVLDNARMAQDAQRNPGKYPMSAITGWNSQDMAPRIQASSGLLDDFHYQLDSLQLNSENRQLEQRQKVDQAAQEAAKQRIKAFEDELQRQKQLYGMNVAQERAFWEEKLAAFNQGSEQYRAVEQKFFQASQAVSKQFEAIRHRTIGENEPAPVMRFDEQQRGVDVLSEAIKRHAIVVAQINAQWAEANDRQLVLTGAMTEHAAAVDIARAHTEAYKAELKALEDTLATLRAENAFALTIGAPVDPQNLAKQEVVQTQIEQLGGRRQIQQMTDALRVTDTTWKGMIDSVFGELERRANQTQDRVRAISLQFIDSVNSELARGAVGGKMDFRKIFQEAGQGLVKTGLEKIEGSVLGSKANPMYTRDADSVTAGAGSGIAKAAGGGLLGMLNDSNFFSSLFGGRVFGAGGIFGGGHALGGDVAAGVPIDVGELGIERFTPMVPGRITPSKDLGGGPLIGYVDARGTDPSLTKANFDRALRQTHARAVNDAGRMLAERSRRRPQ